MPSLTPSHRSEEATSAAARDGLINGALALIPSTAAVYAAMKSSPKFLKSTNWQSRTALCIMPPFFMYALSSEKKLTHKMREMADEADHAKKINEWAEKNKNELKKDKSSLKVEGISDSQLHSLYSKSVLDSGVRIVPGDTLSPHHRVMNFFQEYPFTILSCLGVPAVGYIFMGRNEQKHLQLQSKLMHTRVFGQFTVISLLLSIMGFKTYMDSMGKYITQQEADMRVEEMKRIREDLLRRIAFDKEMKAKRDAMLRKSASVQQ